MSGFFDDAAELAKAGGHRCSGLGAQLHMNGMIAFESIMTLTKPLFGGWWSYQVSQPTNNHFGYTSENNHGH